MEFETLFDDKKTLYSIRNEDNEKSTITIDKWAADLLQEMLPNVHDWIQLKYDLVCEKRPQLSRREKGDLVRLLARKEAENNPRYQSLIDQFI